MVDELGYFVDLSGHYQRHTAKGILPDGVRPEDVRLTMLGVIQCQPRLWVDGVELVWADVRADGVQGYNALLQVYDGDGIAALSAHFEPVSDSRLMCYVSTSFDFIQPALLALVEAINERHGASLTVDGQQAAGGSGGEGQRTTKDTRARFELFKSIKDAKPDLTYLGVAIRATEQYRNELLAVDGWPPSEHDVKNDYNKFAPGEWQRGTKR